MLGAFISSLYMIYGPAINDIDASVVQRLSGVLHVSASPRMPFLLQLIFVVPPFLLALFNIKEPRKLE